MILKFKLYEQSLNNKVDNTVYDNGGYQISINTSVDPTTIKLWFDGESVGVLTLNDYIKSHYDKKYRSVGVVNINDEHKGKGFGIKLYQIALKYMSDDFYGIISDLQNRSNKNQVPKIYKKLGGWEDGDYAIIPRVRNNPQDSINIKTSDEIAIKFGSSVKFIENFVMREIKDNYTTKHQPTKDIYKNLKDDIKMYIEYPNMLKPRELGIGTRKKLVEELMKIKDITFEDIFN